MRRLERVLYELDPRSWGIFCRRADGRGPLAFFGSSSPSPMETEQAKRQMESLPESVLMDVREDHE